MSRTTCEHGVLLERPCYDCQMKAFSGPALTAKDVRIATLETQIKAIFDSHWGYAHNKLRDGSGNCDPTCILCENSRLRHDLANAQQVSQFAMELMHMGEVPL